MNHIHVFDTLAEASRNQERNIFQFLKTNFPNDPKNGSLLKGHVRILPENPTFPTVKPSAYRNYDSSGCTPCILWGNHIFIGNWDARNRESPGSDARGRALQPVQPKVVVVSAVPVTAEVNGNAFTQDVDVDVRDPSTWSWKTQRILDVYTFPVNQQVIPYAYLNVTFTAAGVSPAAGVFKFVRPLYGTAVLDPNGGEEVTVTSELYGMSQTWKDSLKFEAVITKRVEKCGKDSYYLYDREYEEKEFTDPLWVLRTHLKASVCPDGADAWWARLVALNPDIVNLAAEPDKSLASVYKKKDIKPVLERLAAEAPVDWFFFQWLRDGRNKDKRCNNNLLASMLTTVGNDFDKLKTTLGEARQTLLNIPLDAVNSYYAEVFWQKNIEHKQDFWFDARRAICLTLPGAKERHEDLEAKADFTKQRDLTKAADTLEVSEADYPLLRQAIIDGNIPMAVFRQPDKSPVNGEFDLWELALARKGWAEVIYEIAADAARRGTYDRDITPYLAFLFRIETYLDKHALPTKGSKKKGWSAMPKYVQSQSELEMNDDEEATGTIKRRSAFTPVADNDTFTITVPYIAVCVSGVVAQWCYAKHYHVFESGMTDPISGGIVTKDLEVNLNGRDDYGLCFYTLTGTDTATGYPTFLIIFERLAAKTRVHFHRVRPCRSKDGIKTPACKLIEACYQFMAGNVPAQEIAAQQGDLMFIRCDNDPIKAGAKVKDPQEGRVLEFESHRFLPLGIGGVMKLFVSEAKTPANRLGFIWVPNGLKVEHPEHDNINALAEGWWEIRRAKSYENNPVAIWSRTID